MVSFCHDKDNDNPDLERTFACPLQDLKLSSSDLMLGKQAWATDNIVLFPLPMCVAVTLVQPSIICNFPQLEYACTM
jgi:hypothetical protein